VQEAKKQHGVVLVDESRREAVRTKAWARVVPKVWRLVDWPVTDEQALMAATLASSGVASHRAAAWLHGLDGFEHAAAEVSVLRPRHYRHCVSHEVSDLERVDITRVRGIPCTTATRTVIDLGAVTDIDDVWSAFESAVRKGLTSPEYLRRRLDALKRPGRSGIGTARRALARHAGITDSELEVRFLALCRRAGLRPPVLHHHVGPYVVDFAYPELRLAIELDGLAAHGTAAALQHDLIRQNRLVLERWTVLRFTWVDVVERASTVSAAIALAVAA